MCRLFGQLSDPVLSSEAWLRSTDRSLLAQSNVSTETAQKDGWGIGWIDPQHRSYLEKGIAGAFLPSERERFERVAQDAVGPVVVAHLRHASNPMNLPREQLLALENSQPYRHERYLFAHNGSIPLPRETRSKLGPLERHVQGVNDSEVLFWLFLRHVEEREDPVQAFGRTVADLQSVWEEQGRPGDGPYSGLNVVFARGPSELWAFCCSLGEHGSGFFATECPYYEMTYLAEPQRVVVGSEPFDGRSNWNALHNGQYLHASASGGRVETTIGALPLAPRVPSLAAGPG